MSRELLNAIYFTGPFGAAGSALHSIVRVADIPVLYWVLGLGSSDRRRITAMVPAWGVEGTRL